MKQKRKDADELAATQRKKPIADVASDDDTTLRLSCAHARRA